MPAAQRAALRLAGSSTRRLRQGRPGGVCCRSSSMAAATGPVALPGPVVGPGWLRERLEPAGPSGEALGFRGVRVLDASFYLPALQRSGLGEFCAERLPGARFFDPDAVKDCSQVRGGAGTIRPSAAG